MCTTFPGSSAATVTPWTAVKEPTAVSVVSHDSARDTAVVTVSGFGTAFPAWAIIAWICRALTADSAPMSTTRPRMTKRMRFFMVGRLRG